MILKNCWHIKIGGYNAIVDPNGLIVQCDPEIKSLENQNIEQVFKKYKTRAKFERIEKTYYPLFMADDIFLMMAEKNPAIERLKQQFDCEIF